MRLVGLAVVGLLCGLGALALVLTSDHEDATSSFAGLALTLGWAFIGTGLYALWRRPRHRVGQLMILTGFLWFLGALTESDLPFVFTLGLALSGLWAGPFVHLLVAFPTGALGSRRERALVVLGYALTLAQPLTLFFTVPEDCRGCPENLLLIRESSTAETALTTLFGVAGVAMLIGVGA